MLPSRDVSSPGSCVVPASDAAAAACSCAPDALLLSGSSPGLNAGPGAGGPGGWLGWCGRRRWGW